MDNIIRIVVWGGFAVIFGVIFYNKFMGKKKYENVKFDTDPNWLENSINSYPKDSISKYYFFHFDKNYLHQGHVVEDEQHKVVYEIKFLYNNGLADDEVDFVNHIINKTHHHTVGKVTTYGASNGNVSTTIDSSFKFDKKDVFSYLESLGYNYKMHIKLLAYYFDILDEQGNIVGKIYSSNNGKNLYNRNGGEIELKAGGKGLLVLESNYAHLDVVILYALAFARVEFDIKQMSHL